MADADWCRENGIAASTFYNRNGRCRKAEADQKQKIIPYLLKHLPQYFCIRMNHQYPLYCAGTQTPTIPTLTRYISPCCHRLFLPDIFHYSSLSFL